MRQFLLIFVLFSLSFFASAQVNSSINAAASNGLWRQDSVITPLRPLQPEYRTVYIYTNPLDSLYRRKANGTLTLPENLYDSEAMRGLTFRDTLFYSPLYLPMIFTGKMLPRNFVLYAPETPKTKGVLIPQKKTLAPQLQRSDFVNDVRRHYYTTFPDKVGYSALNFGAVPPAITDDEVHESFNPFRELINVETSFTLEVPTITGVEIGRRYWVHSGEHSLQFSQNYFSDNWHKGGTNNMNINNYHVVRANYKKNKVRFNNTLEWRLSVFNAPEDSVRQYRIGEDLIRYYGDFGIDAFVKGWSYSTNLDARSQLFNNYNPNSTDLRSAFLSPLYVNMGVGLKYEMDKRSGTVRHRRTRWTLALAPVSMDFRYVSSDNVDVKRYGIEPGKNTLVDIGSTINSLLIYDYNRYITLTSRLTYFTSYTKIVSEFENTLNMALTNALSTRVYVNLRFDDGVPAHEKFKHWQLNQTLSFGLNYKW